MRKFAVLLLVLILAGCAPAAAVQPTATVSAPAPSVSTSMPGGATVVPTATLAQPADVIWSLDKPQVVLRVGETAALRLDDVYVWTVTIADERVLAALEDAHDGWRRFKGVGNGSTTLTVQGDPVCLQSRPPCMMPSRLVEFQVMVD